MIKYSIECWLFNPLTNCFLLLRCPATEKHEEYWQPVTGGRSQDEPCLQACLREVEEETGILLGPEQVETVISDFSFCIPETRIELRKPVYLARVYSDTVAISSEHIAHGWFKAGEVKRNLHWDSNRESFDQVFRYSRQYVT